ncbi:MAG: hypothetical protein H6673_01430 [Anaerolineales bacterium]|nr:hypothetical protein [Anaerolineales bacterium]
MEARPNALLVLHRIGYEYLIRPLLFRGNPQRAHDVALRWLAFFDRWTIPPIANWTLPNTPVAVGGVQLQQRLILAAGFVKGHGFADEQAALAAVAAGKNIVPGWRSMSQMVGLVEYGSFTRWPRVGNSGTVIWRDVPTRSTQNRIGLKNPGVVAAAEFLSRKPLPFQFGINIAVSPGVEDPSIERQEVLASMAAFLDKGVRPTWFTLNLSCPNTEDDPKGNQTEDKARDLCAAVVAAIDAIPLWVKVGPNLSPAQYQSLMRAFAEVDVKAVIATNTQGAPTPDSQGLTAGIGGGRLHAAALTAVHHLMEAKVSHGYLVDVIGCGGVLDGTSYDAYRKLGVDAMQYWSALIYRGPLAAAQIMREGERRS